jgi:pyruvate formate lyase activating enzyme
MKEAMFYKKLSEDKVQCFLCAHKCRIAEGQHGLCGVRKNQKGVLYSLVYGRLISMNIDPIEKKPLFHFYPGSRSFSIATVGCNFKCLHCQNYDISQYPERHADILEENVTPEQVVDIAERYACKSISYTYTEPTIFFEFAYDCARIAHERGIKNVFVSNGYISTEAVETIAPYLDANNIDLKGDDEFYKNLCGARLKPVLNTIKLMKELGVWVEVTTLIIPTYNDKDELLRWIAEFILSIGAETPWHVTQFYPKYQLMNVSRTPLATLKRAREIGIKVGLKYVYEGNVPGSGGENTYCPACNELLIKRTGFLISKNKMSNSRCFSCGYEIEGVFINHNGC